jgi:nucleotide sugar dehydrogenase
MPDDGDVFVLAVGTPVESPGQGRPPVPSLESIRESAEMVGERLMAGALVVLRSTVPLGATRELVAPVLEAKSGLRAGLDFHLAFAPERTVEGRALEELRQLPQIIGGINEDSVEATVALFRELAPSVVRVESLESAEMAKLINNAYRDVIFGFSNEMARIASAFNLDVSAVIAAANHGYPRDRVPLPSPGVGGPCLTKDPYILASAASRAGIETTMPHHSRRVNESMHGFVSDAVLRELERSGKAAKRATVLICGLAFKGVPETADYRNSSSVEIARILREHVGTVLGHDPLVPALAIEESGMTATKLPGGFKDVDAVLFLNNHPSYQKIDVFEMTRSLRTPGIVYDAWRLFRSEDVLSAAPSVYMGLGFVRRSPERSA